MSDQLNVLEQLSKPITMHERFEMFVYVIMPLMLA